MLILCSGHHYTLGDAGGGETGDAGVESVR